MELNSDKVVVLVLHFLTLIYTTQTAKECVYQYDMANNRVKITCGKGAILQIVDQHGNTLLTGETSGTADTPVVFQLNSSYHWSLNHLHPGRISSTEMDMTSGKYVAFEKKSKKGENPFNYEYTDTEIVRSSISSLNDEAHKATKKLSDASKLLRKVREDLTLQINNLINLTSLLQRGDDELKKDLFTLRRHELTSPLVREAIIAALQNQYNFLRMGLLSQNTQMNELIRTTMRLTTSIMKTARGARGVGEILDLRADVMNETLFNITKLMPGGFEHGAFFGEKTVFCPQELKKISKKGTSVNTGVEQGTIMIDSHTPEKIWVMYGFVNINEVIEYNSLKSLKFELVHKTYDLPFSCVGTGHVVYKQVLYCQKMFTNKIVKYSLAESRWLGERQLDNVGVHDTFPYASGKHTDLDFAIDEKGLWLIYATNSSRGHIVVSKVNDDDLSFDNTWVTEVTKKSAGNAFIICGVLYVMDAFDTAPTYVRYVFDTNKAKGWTLEPEDLPFSNTVSKDYARVYSLDYSPSDQALYSWNSGRIEIYPVSFLDENEP